MTDHELDDVRRIVVAFEDAASWCEQLSELALESILALQRRERLTDDRLSEGLTQLSQLRLHLDVNRREVASIRSRIGIPPLGT